MSKARYSNKLLNFVLKFTLKTIDWIVVKELSMILEKTPESNEKTDALIKSLIYLLNKNHGTSDTEWFCACEQILNTIFIITKRPENISEYLILKLSKFIFTNKETKSIEYPKSPSMQLPPGTQSQGQGEDYITSPRMDYLTSPRPDDEKSSLEFEDKLTQLIFVVGHVAIKFIFYVDVIENELKRMKNEAETKEQKQDKDEDLDKIHGGTEAYFEKGIEELHKISEGCIVFKNLLSFYSPLLKQMCSDIISKKGLKNQVLERVVVLSLCKYMCVSADFCQEHLNTLFTLLKAKVDPVTKTNIIISLGDLIHRHPNICEPYTSTLYHK